MLRRPTRIPTLLSKLGGLLLPVLRYLTGFDRFLLFLAVVLPRSLNDRRVDDLPALGQISGPREMLVEAGEQNVITCRRTDDAESSQSRELLTLCSLLHHRRWLHP